MRSLLVLVVARGGAALRPRGGIALPVAPAPVPATRPRCGAPSDFGPPDFDLGRVAFPVGVLLPHRPRRRPARVASCARWRDAAEARARPRRSGCATSSSRRLDLLEAANRCARALGSSLDLDEAFDAFIRELRGLVPFDRAVILPSRRTAAREAMAVAGLGAEQLPPGATRPSRGSVVEHVAETGRIVYRPDMSDQRYRRGGGARRARPALAGRRAAPARRRVRSGAQRRRAASRTRSAGGGRAHRRCSAGWSRTRSRTSAPTRPSGRRVEELRRLSALRADFVSLVSHELRSPMAAVIGAARTLQQRWREPLAGAARGVPRP